MDYKMDQGDADQGYPGPSVNDVPCGAREQKTRIPAGLDPPLKSSCWNNEEVGPSDRGQGKRDAECDIGDEIDLRSDRHPTPT